MEFLPSDLSLFVVVRGHRASHLVDFDGYKKPDPRLLVDRIYLLGIEPMFTHEVL